MGNCSSSIEVPSAVADGKAVPVGVPIYRRDDLDRLEMRKVIQAERGRLESAGYSSNVIEAHMKGFSKGVWEGYKSLSALNKSDSIAYNRKMNADPDHWYEINTANAALFNYLSLAGLPEVLPGRLFSTRMPRDLKSNPESAAAFKKKVEEHKLHSCLVLAETKEYQKYAGSDLEEFYRSIGINVIHRPMPDFSIPKETDMMKDIKDLTDLLSDGKNCLIHCAGGNGRTGTVIAGIMKNVGVKSPVAAIRRVKTQYVETPEQEKFINEHIPVAIDADLVKKHPLLAKAIAAEHILDTIASGAKVADDSTIQISITDSSDFDYVFDLLDSEGTGELTVDELCALFESLGSTISTEDVSKFLKTENGRLTKPEFIALMNLSVA